MIQDMPYASSVREIRDTIHHPREHLLNPLWNVYGRVAYVFPAPYRYIFASSTFLFFFFILLSALMADWTWSNLTFRFRTVVSGLFLFFFVDAFRIVFREKQF